MKVDIVYDALTQVGRGDAKFINSVRRAWSRTKGATPFSNDINQFAFYFMTYNIGRKSASINIAELKEHILYMFWTFLEPSLLTPIQFSRYIQYQQGTITTLPRKRQSLSTNVFSYDMLRSLCPPSNSYLTVGCLVSIGYNCQIQSTGCKGSFVELPSKHRLIAAVTLETVCPIVKSSYAVLCGSTYRNWATIGDSL